MYVVECLPPQRRRCRLNLIHLDIMESMPRLEALRFLLGIVVQRDSGTPLAGPPKFGNKRTSWVI